MVETVDLPQAAFYAAWSKGIIIKLERCVWASSRRFFYSYSWISPHWVVVGL